MEGLEQAPELILWRVGEVEGEEGERVQEGDVVLCWFVRVGLSNRVKVGNGGERRLLLDLQFVVGGPQGLGERVVGIAVWAWRRIEVWRRARSWTTRCSRSRSTWRC